MEVLLLIAILFIVSRLSIAYREPIKTEVPTKLIVEKKACPPHKWEWQEITDQEGNKQGQRIICLTCAQTPGNII